MILFENTVKEYPRLEARLQAVDICFCYLWKYLGSSLLTL